jgi:hypothetical protein
LVGIPEVWKPPNTRRSEKKEKMCTDILILAGGAGERFWPASTADKPKQFMSLFEGMSFLQHTVLRASV